ncbi:MAG: hypothetical protein EA412_08410 [Chitinophagaceae bacterium]|nr:MAG: hypothetical protein EA412_08410 [Chitinophagaceae bacterium]
MRGLLKYYGIERIYILGAGFSRPAGLPLTCDLIKEVHKKSGTKPWLLGNNKSAEWGQADWLIDELRYYYPTTRINHKRILENKLPIDIEEFLSYVAASSAFIENTNERWSDHGSKFQSFIKQWLAEVIYDHQVQIEPKQQELYNQFAKNLKKSLIITFNWDTILEDTLRELEIPFAYDLNTAIETECLALIKMHGSIDCFKPRDYNYRNLGKQKFLPLSKSISNMYRYEGDIQDCFNNHMTPYIITPNFDKLSQLKNFWRLMEHALDISTGRIGSSNNWV